MGTSQSLSLFTLFLALAGTPQSAVALRLAPFTATVATVEPVFSIPEAVASGTTLKIDSSSALAGVNEVLEKRFENQFSGTQVDINYTSSDEALAALDGGEIDIAAIGRPLSDAEKAQGYTEVLLGRHKIAIIVSENNSFSGGVTTVQFSQIFRGEITDWSELEGGTAGAIRLVDRPEANDTRQALSAYPVFQEAPFETGTTADAVSEESTAALIDALGTDGIGFAIADQVINRPGIRVLSMHKVLPTNPAYPFSQPMSYVYKGDASPAVQAFLGYVTASDTAELLDEAKTLGAKATFEGLQGAPNLDSTVVADLVGSPSGVDTSGTSSAGIDSNVSTPSDSDAVEGPTGTSTGNADGSGETDTAATEDPSVIDGAGTETANNGDGSVTENTTGQTGESANVPASDSANTEGVTADGANTTGDSTVDTVDEATATDTPQRKMPWWLLWLFGIPVFGGLLWWLMSRRTDDGDEVSPIAGIDPSTIGVATGAAAAGTVATTAAGMFATSPQRNQMVLVPRDAQSAYAYWEVSEDSLAQLRDDGGEELGLRLYDVTSWEQESELPQPLYQEKLDESECDRHLTIPTPDRDYVAEVGYLTSSSQWLSAARSEPVHVSSDLSITDSTATDSQSHFLGTPGVEVSGNESFSIPKPPGEPQKEGVATADNNLIKGAAIAGTAAVAAGAATISDRMGSGTKAKAPSTNVKGTELNRMILVPREGQHAYAYWEISEQKKAALQQQGGEKLLLRLYDVTGINPRTEKPHSVQQFDCNVQENDLHVTVPKTDRTYLADLGYTTATGKWLRLAHAAPVQVPSKDNAPDVRNDTDNGSGVNIGGIVDGFTEKTSDAVQSSKAAVGAGQSAIEKMAKSAIKTGAATGQSLVGAVQTGPSLMTGSAVATDNIGVAATIPEVVQSIQIVLVARNAEAAYAYWEVPDRIDAKLRSQNVETLSLRLHDVTNIDLDHSPAHSTQVFECNVTDRDCHVPIASPNKDYLAELGYTQADGTWVQLARSLHIRVA